MAKYVNQLRHLFSLPAGSEGAMAALQQFPEPKRRILLAIRGLKDYSQLPVPGDFGFGILARLDEVFLQQMAQERTDRAWLVRAAACLFALVIEVRAQGVFEAPLGAPIFMAVSPRRPEPVLVSPLRLALDALRHDQPGFRDSCADVLAFHEGRRPLAEHLFRVDPVGVGESLRATWQWAWSLVAVCGQFGRGRWDLDFSVHSLQRLGAILVRGESALEEQVSLALRSVDLDKRKREAWLLTAAGCYLGEVFRRHLGGHWKTDRPGEPGTLLVFHESAFELPVTRWARVCAMQPNEAFLVDLAQAVALARAGAAPWPHPPLDAPA